MRRLVRVTGTFASFSLFALTPPAGAADVAAQVRPEANTTWDLQPPSLPASMLVSTPTSFLDVFPAAQERRLPVYDDDGEVIPYEEIMARVDPSGSKGGTWGFIAGAVGGLAIGAIIGRCGGVRGGYRYYCSPREESLQTALPLGLGFTFGMGLGWAGWNADRTTFDEAVEEIRLQRRLNR